MAMQDNEFDDLFRSKLEHFEVEPAENLWPGIDTAIQSKRRRAILLPMIRIAAVLLVALSLGWIYIQRQHDQPADKKPRVAVEVKKQLPPSTPAIIKPVAQSASHVKATVNTAVAKTGKAKPVIIPDNIKEALPNKQQGTKVNPDAIQVTMAELSPASAIKLHVVPEKDVPLNIDLPDQPVITKAATSTVVSAQVTNIDEQANSATNVSTRPGTKRGLASLVSLVSDRFNKSRAALVDNDDDDESVIGEVSKGIKKIKKDKEIKGSR